MKIGLDISQLAYTNTGVANYLLNFVTTLIKLDSSNEYVLFYSSFSKTLNDTGLKIHQNDNVTIKRYKIPTQMLEFIWNRLHIFPIENFVGDVDVFITSDWTEPPIRKAKKATILYDLIVYKYPQETHEKIISVQKRKLQWVKKKINCRFLYF